MVARLQVVFVADLILAGVVRVVALRVMVVAFDVFQRRSDIGQHAVLSHAKYVVDISHDLIRLTASPLDYR